MRVRNSFPSMFLFSVVGFGVTTPAVSAEGADQKEACLAAADTGQSLRDDGQYSIAREQFVACSRDVCPKLVHDQCTEWLRQLDEATPTVIFGAKDDHGSEVSARVLLDGKPIASSVDHKPVNVDPGPHDVRFEHDPDEPITMHVVVRAGEKNRDVSATFPLVEAPTPPAPHEEVAPEAPPPGAETVPSTPSSSGRLIASVSLLAAGVVAGGLGFYFGLQSQSENDQAVTLRNSLPARWSCTNPSRMNQSTCTNLSSTKDVQNRDAMLNGTLYIAGGALVVAAAATWFLWPKRQGEHAPTAWVAPVVGPTQAGVGMGGAF
jgi:hypothetical protein